MQVNIDKCKWFQDTVTYLGFVITRTGIRPQLEKIQGILNIKTPKMQREVFFCFVGMIKFYRDLYPKRAEILAPLTNLCGQNKKFHWSDEQNTAFNKIKDLLMQETMLTYPKFDQPFVIYTDASEKQIGGIMTQDGKPLGFFSRKLSNTQRCYPVTEQELLAISETLKYYKHMLLGHKIIIKTDHKNLTHPLSIHASDRVLHQRLLLEEYGADLQYIQGEKTVAADALSRLPTEAFFSFDDANDNFPLNINLLAVKQLTDTHLQAALDKQHPIYIKTVREGCKIYVHKETNTVYVPASLQSALLQWYHTTLQHPGIKRMQATVKEILLAWPRCRSRQASTHLCSVPNM
jgi:hypothetical protein